MSNLIALVAIFTALCLVLGIAGYLSDRWLERNKPLPPPDDPRLRNSTGILEWKAKRTQRGRWTH